MPHTQDSTGGPDPSCPGTWAASWQTRGLSTGSSVRCSQHPYLHQEAEGPASFMLQDSELHASCKDSKVSRMGGSGPPGLPGPISPLLCVSAEAGAPERLWK